MTSFDKKSIFTVAVSRDFIAQHFLFGGDWGAENFPHSHHYEVELQLEGAELDQHGYLVDIVEIESALDDLIAHYRDKTLNELPEFKELNPSIERLSQFFCDALCDGIQADNVGAITVRIWENEIAWAAYRRERR